MSKKNEIFITIFLVLITSCFWLFFNLKPLTGLILITLAPSLFLIIRGRQNYKKLSLALLIFGGLFGFIFDFIATYNNAWVVDRLIIPFKILNILPIDDILGFLCMTLFILIFYEHFIDDEKNKKISKNLLWLLIPSVITSLFIVISFLVTKNSLKISYVYLYSGLAAIVFPIAMSIYKPILFNKFLLTAAFFFFVWFCAEIAAVKTGGWYFFGNYIGSVEIVGVKFPFEELLFWMMFYAATIVSYYEFFIDDAK